MRYFIIILLLSILSLCKETVPAQKEGTVGDDYGYSYATCIKNAVDSYNISSEFNEGYIPREQNQANLKRVDQQCRSVSNP